MPASRQRRLKAAQALGGTGVDVDLADLGAQRLAADAQVAGHAANGVALGSR
jgi:hypothetical protein